MWVQYDIHDNLLDGKLTLIPTRPWGCVHERGGLVVHATSLVPDEVSQNKIF